MASDLTVSGPYQYDLDSHPAFRIDSADRLIALVYASDGDEDAAEVLANRIAEAIQQFPLSNSDRLPTLCEAKAAAAILRKCNGWDLSVWTDDVWPSDDLKDACEALAKAALHPTQQPPHAGDGQ
jgi:hypothetical protein